MADLKILALQNLEFKYLADFKILSLQNLEFKILADFKILAFKIGIPRLSPISGF